MNLEYIVNMDDQCPIQLGINTFWHFYFNIIYHTNLVAIDNILVNSPSLPLSMDGIGTLIRVPVGVPLSSTNTMLLLSMRGTVAFCFCFTPTIKALFFCPLMATNTLSPIVPTPFLLYTWMHFAGFPATSAARPSWLLSTTRSRVILMMWLRDGLQLKNKMSNINWNLFNAWLII